MRVFLKSEALALTRSDKFDLGNASGEASYGHCVKRIDH